MENHIRSQYLLISITQAFRKLFKNRWTRSKGIQWVDGHDQFETFLREHGPSIYVNLNKTLQRVADDGKIENMDISLLFIVLTKSIWNGIDYTLENEIVTKLKNIRNEVIHSGSFSKEQFDQICKQITDLFTLLGEDTAEIEIIKISDLKDLSNFATKRLSNSNDDFNALKSQANTYFNEKKFTEAIDLYTRAMQCPSLTYKEIAILFSNRSFSHLENGNANLALSDAKCSILYSPDWEKGYFRKGQALHSLHKYAKAVQAYDHALVIMPTNTEILNAKSSSVSQLRQQQRHEHMDYNFLPVGLQEKLDQMTKKTQIKLDAKQVQDAVNMFENAGSAKGICYKGLIYDQQGDYIEAAKYLAIAANKGDAEAMYNLGVYYKKGKGVKQDFQLAKMYYKKAISQPLKINGTLNTGVRESEQAMGNLYAEGFGVSENLSKAFSWYLKSAEHGYIHAINDVGVCYEEGKGVNQDYRKAFQYYYKATSMEGGAKAMNNLGNLYLNGFGVLKDGEKALKWFIQSYENGYLMAELSQKNAKKLIKQQRKLLNNKIIKWEKKNHKIISNLTIVERIESYLQFNIPEDLYSTMNKIFDNSNTKKKRGYSIGTKVEKYPLEELEKYAPNSAMASKLLHSKQLSTMAVFLLTNNTYGENNDEIVQVLASSFEISIYCADFCRSELLNVAKKVLEKDPLNIYAQICFAVLTLHLTRDEIFVINYLTKCITQHPNKIYLRKLKAERMCRINNTDGSLKEFNELIKLDPILYSSYYGRAKVYFDKSNFEKSRNDLFEFLKLVDIDDFLIPTVYYLLSRNYIMERNVEKAKEYFNEGLIAEKKLSPIFLPYNNIHKDKAELFIRLSDLASK